MSSFHTSLMCFLEGGHPTPAFSWPSLTSNTRWVSAVCVWSWFGWRRTLTFDLFSSNKMSDQNLLWSIQQPSVVMIYKKLPVSFSPWCICNTIIIAKLLSSPYVPTGNNQHMWSSIKCFTVTICHSARCIVHIFAKTRIFCSIYAKSAQHVKNSIICSLPCLMGGRHQPGRCIRPNAET